MISSPVLVQPQSGVVLSQKSRSRVGVTGFGRLSPGPEGTHCQEGQNPSQALWLVGSPVSSPFEAQYRLQKVGSYKKLPTSFLLVLTK